MKSVTITMNDLSDIKLLSKMAEKAYGTVILKKGTYCVDAASLLGVIAIDPTNPIVCEYEEENVGLDSFLEKFKVSGN